MNLQDIFYLLGTVVFAIAILVFFVSLILGVSFYRRYRKFLLESKQRVARLKRSVTALPFLPIIGFLFRKFRKRSKTN